MHNEAPRAPDGEAIPLEMHEPPEAEIMERMRDVSARLGGAPIEQPSPMQAWPDGVTLTARVAGGGEQCDTFGGTRSQTKMAMDIQQTSVRVK